MKREFRQWVSPIGCLLFLLMGQMALAQGYVTLGTQGAQSGNLTSSPANGYYESRHIQIVYTASELLDNGGAAGNIQRLAWDVSVLYAGGALPSYTVKMGHISTATNPSTTYVTGLTTVKNAYSYTPALGFNDITFDTPFNWNGTDNIIIDICFNDAPYVSPYGQVWNYTGVADSYRSSQSDPTNLCGSATSDQSYSAKPRVRFYMQQIPACAGTPNGGSSASNLNRFICNGSAPGAITVTGASPAVQSGISYQWEESINGGTSWANATAGTGATTATYTPPNFAGVNIQYRLKVTCANGAAFAYSNVTSVSNPAAPATQASALLFTAQSNTTFNVAWTNGTGSRRMVVISTTPITDPVSGNTPAITANSTFANTGQQIVYDGTGTSVTVSGLTCNTTYNVKVYEYNRCGAGPYDYYYNVTGTASTVMTTAPALSASFPNTTFTGYNGDNLSTILPGWYEASISSTEGVAPSSSNPSGTTSGWVSTSLGGVTTAKFNLYAGNQNGWIISPKVAIASSTRLKFKAALTAYNSSGTTTGMQGTDDKVKVMISTDGCGAVWTPLYTFQASNTATLTNALTNFTIVLPPMYIGQTVQIAFQATDGPLNESPDYDFHIANILMELVPACDVPALSATTNITKNSATINWNTPAVGVPSGYEYVVSTSSVAPAGAGTANADTNVDVTGLSSDTMYYIFVRTVCTDVFSDWSVAGTFMTLCNHADVLTTTGDSVCGRGIADLAATVSPGGILKWYAAATGGAALATGPAYSTPLLTATTNYYVSGANATPNLNAAVGSGALTGSSGGVSPFYHGWGGVKTQFIITAAEMNAAGILAGPINSAGFTVTGLGAPAYESFALSIGTTTQSVATNTHIEGLTPVYSNASQTLTMGLNMFTFTAPFMWDGTSNIVVSTCYHNPATPTGGSSATVQYDSTSFAAATYTYADNQTAATVCAATTGAVGGSGGTATSNSRAKITFNATALCESPRVMVTATVTDAPDVVLAATESTICNGESTQISVTSANAGYAYVWMPGNLSGAMQTVNPSATTIYTVTATDMVTQCVEVGTITINVNALPAAFTISPANAVVCEGGSGMLTANGVDVTANAVLGTGTTAPSTTSYPNPLSAYYGGTKTQILFTEAELMAQGMVAGSAINSLAFDLESSAANALFEFKIRLGATTNMNTTGGFVPNGTFTTVYNGTFTPTAGATGLVVFTFTAPYTWNGGNLIVDVIHNQGNSGNGSGTRTRTTTTSFNSVWTGASDGIPGGVANFDTLTSYSVNSASMSRPNVVFSYVINNEVEWTPTTNLFTDANTTVPYTGQDVNVVYTRPTANSTYTATVTNAAGCTISQNVNVTISITPAPVVANAVQTFCNSATIANLVATGTGIKWYYTASGGNAIAMTTPLTDGTVYYASQTLNGCEGLSRTPATADVNVTAAPTAATNPQVFCNTATVGNLTATGTGIQWYAALTGGTALDAATVIPAGVTIYYASQTIAGCESAARLAVVAQVNVTAAPIADTELAFCNAATVADLEAIGSGIKWYAASEGGTALTNDVALVNGSSYFASQTVAGCESMMRTEVTVLINTPAAPVAANATQTFCNAATVAELVATGSNVMWYAASEGGTALSADAALVDGMMYYASQTIDGCESLGRTMVTADVNVTPSPELPEDAPVFCNAATIADIDTDGNVVIWYSAASGGMALAANTALADGMSYFASQIIDGCESMERTEVVVTINVTAAPTGDATQGFCTSAMISDLVAEGESIMWYTAETGGSMLSGDDALTDGMVYYASQSIDGCESMGRFAVTASITTVTVDTLEDVTTCDSYTLEALENGAYYTAENGGGTMMNAGDAITEDTTLYVYASAGTDPVCTAQSSFTITINSAAAPTGEATQTVTVNNAADATIEDLMVNGDGTVTWYASEEDVANGNALPAGTQLVAGENYFATLTVGDCTSAAFEVTADVVLGRNDFDKDAFTYHPNPVKDVLNISYSSDITSVAVFNLLGQQVMNVTPNATAAKLDMSALSDGAYIVNVTSGNVVKTIKVVKKQ